MGGIIIMRILVKNSKIKDFINNITREPLTIINIYNEDYGFDNAVEFMTMPDYMGYYDPVSLYGKLKDSVEDIWSLSVGDPILKVGKNFIEREDYTWESSKQRYLEDEKRDEKNDEK